MGILPLRLPAGMSPGELNIVAGDRIEVDADAARLQPRCEVAVRLVRKDGQAENIAARAAVETQLEVELLRRGGVIPFILRNTIEAQRQS